jgi:cobalamin biosynthetic protein CobC
MLKAVKLSIEGSDGSDAPQEHGGDLAAIGAAFPDAPKPWIDLSTGINPWPYPIRKLPDQAWQRLPSAADEIAVRDAAAACYGMRARDDVVLAPGSQAIIQWLPRLRSRSRVTVLGPTYGEHAKCWRAAGHEVSQVLAPEQMPAESDVIVVVRPNNPDGRVVPLSWLQAAAAGLHRRGGWLVLDEAFADADQTASAAAVLNGENVVALRSFGKFFGLAGGRLGFALVSATLAGALRDALGPWSVSGPMLALAARALRDGAWIARTRTRLARGAGRLDRIAAGAGLTLIGGTTLFRLYAHPEAPKIFSTLAADGLYVRRFQANPHWLRLGLPPDAKAERRLVRALEDQS